MLLTLITEQKIHTSSLPDEPSGMSWVSEAGGPGARRFGLIEARGGAWVLSPRKGMQLLDAEGVEQDSVAAGRARESAYRLGVPGSYATLVTRGETEGDRRFRIIGFKGDEVLTIGSGAENTFTYASAFVAGEHARIDYCRDVFYLTPLDSEAGTFVNGTRLAPHARHGLKAGDIVEVLGLIMTIGHRFVSLNNPSDALTIHDNDNFVYFTPPPYTPPERDPEDDDTVEYFYPAPRFKRDIERRVFTVDAPPPPEKPDETPIAMKIGPSMVMALAAVFSGAIMFTNMMDSGGSVLRAMPMLVMAVAMVAGAVIWPVANRRFQNRKAKRDEARRRAVYTTYLDSFRLRLEEETRFQHAILTENRVPVSECMRRALTHDAILMDRTSAHDDFLELRVGMGTVALAADVRYPDERFTLERDELAEVVYALSREPREIKDAPVGLSLAAHPVIGIAGAEEDTRPFAFGLVAQTAALHSYEDVKCGLFVDEGDKEQWGWVTSLPHIFDDAQTARLFATSLEEAAEVGLMLERVAEERRSATDRAEPAPHYVLFVPSKRLADKSELITGLARRPAPGMTVVCLARSAKDLPRHCSVIIELEGEGGSLRTKDDVSATAHAFAPDIALEAHEGRALARALNAITLDLAESRSALPDSLGFLECFEAGNLEQLNVRSRWARHAACATLQAQVGVGLQGEPFYLNLHERFHGPHGLIAGTTGSGKSELIITWVLSLCINYSPEEVAFVLIDYKGGGLAGAFDNDRVRLPHLAGTITNLDGAAINRSLVSIKSELKRRQALLNDAREAAGGDNMDIYRYLGLYHRGALSEPCPHLFIVADEFAELKQQEPEFMDELISAARIGRSLGVHLVLATQKPAGVVNDQIWSNSRLKVCLKVADKADSNEMIKRADAAEITLPGRFFMLVGYNEHFAQGQSAYTGGPYVPSGQYAPPRDDSVVLVSNTGRALQSARPASGTPGARKPASESVAVLRHLAEVAACEGLAAPRLWLDPLPGHITVDELEEKYAEECEALRTDPFRLEPILGELDDPESQDQRLLTLPLSREGNAVVYGSAGSGVEAVLTTALYSLVSGHEVSELNIFIMDFGSEALGCFRDAPQVGGFCTLADEDRVERLLQFIGREIKSRSKILANHGGGFKGYSQKHHDMPSLVVVLNEIATFAEVFGQEAEQLLVSLTRECTRCGIFFLVGASAPSDLRMRLRQNFPLKYALSLNDKTDYLDIVGSTRGIPAPKEYARGLVALDETIYEFQAAFVSPKRGEDFSETQSLCEALLSESAERAEEIPVLPEHVSKETLLKHTGSISGIPIGLRCIDLKVALLDIESSLITRIAAKRIDDTLTMIRGFIEILAAHKEVDLVVLDASQLLGNAPDSIQCVADPDQAAKCLSRFAGRRGSMADNATPLVVCLALDLMTLLTAFPESPDCLNALNASMPSQALKDGVRYIFVTSGAQMQDYMNRPFCAMHMQRDAGIWVGGGLRNATSTFDLGSTLVSKLPKAARNEGFVVLDAEVDHVRFVEPEGTGYDNVYSF